MENRVSLDGKKLLFVGNSFIYYGQTVLAKSAGGYPGIDKRKNDKGFFYQLCKANGENVSVTNWTFGNHRLTELFSGEPCHHSDCKAIGTNHLEELSDKYYDYVVISEGSGLECDGVFRENVSKIVKLFRAENPNVKFVYLVHTSSHAYSFLKVIQPNILNSLKELESEGFIIADWGALVKDIGSGRVKVPGASLDYNKSTFLINKSEKDGYHPNQLSGYITTLMTYAAITGRSAVGQPYAFVGDKSYESSSMYRTFDEYIATYYTNGETNYDKVFASREDMEGLQRLIDLYLSEKPYLKYNF